MASKKILNIVLCFFLQGCISDPSGMILKASLQDWKWREIDRAAYEIEVLGEWRQVHMLLYDEIL